MSLYLTNNDYRKILNFYGIDVPKKTKTSKVKDMAENILAKKLCRCIKKVKTDDESESRAIAICNKTIFKNRGLKHYYFTCKKKPKLHHKKGTRRALIKISKNKSYLKKIARIEKILGGKKKFKKTRKRHT
jgi:hypothetical protein